VLLLLFFSHLQSKREEMEVVLRTAMPVEHGFNGGVR
jgi:hypothetical protein